MNWFGRHVVPEASAPLPKTDDPAPAPIPLPRMSPEREQAIAAAVAAGRASDLRHALFLHAAGELSLPV